MTFDRVFLDADAVTADDGICEADQAQTRLKELMARRGANVYVLADSSKLGQRPFHAWVRLPRPWTLVTDDGADPHQIMLFREEGGHRRASSPRPRRAGPQQGRLNQCGRSRYSPGLRWRIPVNVATRWLIL